MSALSRNCRWTACICAVLAFLSYPVMAQSPPRAQLKGAFNERMTPDVVVGGAVIVGMSIDTAFDGAALGSLAVHSTEGLQTVCLTVQSQDGVYSARNEYVFPSGLESGQPILLPYEYSRFLDILSDYKDESLAFKAASGPCDQTESNALLAVQRANNAGVTSALSLRFYVNAFGATDVFIRTDQEDGTCRPVQGLQTSFDHICRIALPAATGSGMHAIHVHIERERYGRELPPTEVRVLHAAPES